MRYQQAQTILEFSASMVIICLLIVGLVGVFRWGLMDMAERRYDHDMVLTNADVATVGAQLNPDFHQTRPLDAVFQRK